jgi:oligopeptide/dipeptide ABC transporter ATP-binding protein
VRDVSLAIEPGRTLALVGESGSGKSVTSLAVMGLLPPQAQVRGRILLDGSDLLALREEQMRAVRGTRIGMIFQEPMTALNPVMRVGDQIAEAVLAHSSAHLSIRSSDPMRHSDVVDRGAASLSRDRVCSMRRITKSEAWNLALQSMRDVGIPDHERRARDYPHQLSGGQRQRIMIAMAIVNRPELLIADEPTTALDVTIQAQILELLAQLREKFRLAMLFISHDLAVVSHVADDIAVMYAGSIVELAPARSIFENPVHPYTRGLLSAVPTLKTDRGRQLQTVEGTVPSPGSFAPGCTFAPRCDRRIGQCGAELPALTAFGPDHWARCVNPKRVGTEAQ